MDGLTSADESIRPVSTDLDIGGVTDASSWVGDCVTMRRGASSRASRPLTRYLPVTTQVIILSPPHEKIIELGYIQ